MVIRHSTFGSIYVYRQDIVFVQITLWIEIRFQVCALLQCTAQHITMLLTNNHVSLLQTQTACISWLEERVGHAEQARCTTV